MSNKYTLHIREGKNWPQFVDDLRWVASGSDFELKVSNYMRTDEFILEPHGYKYSHDGIPLYNKYSMTFNFVDDYTTATSIINDTDSYPVKHSLWQRFKRLLT